MQHIPPPAAEIEANAKVEPEGERLRRELADWLERNRVVSMLLDTAHHSVEIRAPRLPDHMKPVLTKWGSIYVDATDPAPVDIGIGGDAPGQRDIACRECGVRFGRQHRPSCHRQGLVTSESAL